MKQSMMALLVLAAFSLPLHAQDAAKKTPPPSSEQVQKMMESTMGMMVPLMGRMMDTMIEVMLQRGEDPATAKRVARFKRNLYDALVKEGFTPEQALQVMLNTGLPAATPQMK